MKGDFFMKNATHRVVILKNLNSDLISQAIIFLKDSCSEPESKILAEAEKIVEKYMLTAQSPPALNTQKKSPDRTLIKIVVTGLLSLAILGIVIAII